MRDAESGTGGDNDPIDVLHAADTPCTAGEVLPVRIVGALAMVDQGGDIPEMDWKLIVVDHNSSARSTDDLPAGWVAVTREWFRTYKPNVTNTFAYGGDVVNRTQAIAVTMATHRYWRRLQKCSFALHKTGAAIPAPCWRSIFM